MVSIANALGQFHIQSVDAYGKTVTQSLPIGQAFSIALTATSASGPVAGVVNIVTYDGAGIYSVSYTDLAVALLNLSMALQGQPFTQCLSGCFVDSQAGGAVNMANSILLAPLPTLLVAGSSLSGRLQTRDDCNKNRTSRVVPVITW